MISAIFYQTKFTITCENQFFVTDFDFQKKEIESRKKSLSNSFLTVYLNLVINYFYQV